MFYNQTTNPTGTGSTPSSVAVVDVNGDNKPDIVVANSGGANVGVLFNTGNGTFLNQTTYTAAASAPVSVAVVDVNGDNKPDIVVANSGTANVGVLFNIGNGTFLSQTPYTTGGGSSPRSVAVVDVNGDNKPDIVVANSGGNNVGVLLNIGNGTFLSQTPYTTGGGSSPRSVAVVDVNGDNKPDIVVANNNNNVGVLFNIGNGTFLSQTTYTTGGGSAPRSVAVADVNGDNKPDIVVANSGTANVGVLFNIGNGTFLPQTTFTTGGGSSPRSVAVVDVNGDNKPDIVVANNVNSTVGVLFNIGNGTFLPQTIYSTGAASTPIAVAVGDVNNDNKTDIVVANSVGVNVGVLLRC